MGRKLLCFNARHVLFNPRSIPCVITQVCKPPGTRETSLQTALLHVAASLLEEVGGGTDRQM